MSGRQWQRGNLDSDREGDTGKPQWKVIKQPRRTAAGASSSSLAFLFFFFFRSDKVACGLG